VVGRTKDGQTSIQFDKGVVWNTTSSPWGERALVSWGVGEANTLAQAVDGGALEVIVEPAYHLAPEGRRSPSAPETDRQGSRGAGDLAQPRAANGSDGVPPRTASLDSLIPRKTFWALKLDGGGAVTQNHDN
jgi:hypothetical protein